MVFSFYYYYYFLYLLCSFYIFCLVILSFHLILSAFSFWHFSVEKKAWKSVCPSRPLKLVISRIAVSCHSIFKFESLKSSVCCFHSTLPATHSPCQDLSFERALLLLWNNTKKKPNQNHQTKKSILKLIQQRLLFAVQTKPKQTIHKMVFFRNLMFFISILLNNLRKKHKL